MKKCLRSNNEAADDRGRPPFEPSPGRALRLLFSRAVPSRLANRIVPEIIQQRKSVEIIYRVRRCGNGSSGSASRNPRSEGQLEVAVSEAQASRKRDWSGLLDRDDRKQSSVQAPGLASLLCSDEFTKG